MAAQPAAGGAATPARETPRSALTAVPAIPTPARGRGVETTHLQEGFPHSRLQGSPPQRPPRQSPGSTLDGRGSSRDVSGPERPSLPPRLRRSPTMRITTIATRVESRIQRTGNGATSRRTNRELGKISSALEQKSSTAMTQRAMSHSAVVARRALGFKGARAHVPRAKGLRATAHFGAWVPVRHRPRLGRTSRACSGSRGSSKCSFAEPDAASWTPRRKQEVRAKMPPGQHSESISGTAQEDHRKPTSCHEGKNRPGRIDSHRSQPGQQRRRSEEKNRKPSAIRSSHPRRKIRSLIFRNSHRPPDRCHQDLDQMVQRAYP